MGDLGLIPGLGRYPGEGNGNPLQYSCLENSMDRGAWWATVHGVAKSRTWLSDSHTHTYTHTHTHITVIILNLAKVKCSISFLDQLIIIFYQLWDARYILQRQWGALGNWGKAGSNRPIFIVSVLRTFYSFIKWFHGSLLIFTYFGT